MGDMFQKQTTDEHFLRSAAEVSCFFEQKAFDSRGTLVKAKAVSINKIGHAMHDLDPVFTPFSRSAALGRVLRAVGLQAPTPVQSMYIFKQPFIGGACACVWERVCACGRMGGCDKQRSRPKSRQSTSVY